MKKYTFSNPIKEALEIQGKRWNVIFWVATAMLAILSVVAFGVMNMPICGSVAAVAAVLSSAFFICHFGFDIKVEENEEE